MLSEITLEALLEFRAQRDWGKFHTPRNLAISISLEAAELLEIFQWAREDSEAAEKVAQRMERVEEELADLVIYLTYLSHDLDVDLESVVRRKLALNELKYPIEAAKGSSTKYDEL